MLICEDCGYRAKEFDESMTVYRPEIICPNCESGRVKNNETEEQEA